MRKELHAQGTGRQHPKSRTGCFGCGGGSSVTATDIRLPWKLFHQKLPFGAKSPGGAAGEVVG